MMLWGHIAIVFLLSPGRAELFNPSEDSLNLQTVDCIIDIADKYFTVERTIVLSQNLQPSFLIDNILERLNFIALWPIVVSRPKNGEDFSNINQNARDKHHSHVMHIAYSNGSIDRPLFDLKEQLGDLKSFSSWNCRGKYVLILTGAQDAQNKKDLVREVLKEFWLWKIYNVIVLLPSLKERDFVFIEVYTWYPYQLPSGNCGSIQEIVLLDSWMSSESQKGKFQKNSDLFPAKMNNMNGCVFRVWTINFAPFIIVQNNTIVGGSDIQIVTALAKYMNATLTFDIFVGKERKGQKLPNGTWTGLRGKLHYDQADIVYGSLLGNYDNHVYFDQSRPYFFDDFTWLLKRSPPYPRWLGVTRVFTTSAWVLHFLTIFLTGAIAYLLSTFPNSEFWNFSKCIISVWAAFLGAGMPDMPRDTVLRVVFLFWIVVSFGVNSVFQAFFTSYQIDPGHRHQISTADELYSSKIVYIFSTPIDKFFTPQVLKKLVPRVRCEAVSCLYEVAVDKNEAAVIAGGGVIDYHRENVRKVTNREVFVFPEAMFQLQIITLLQKDSRHLVRVNEYNARLVESGLVKFWLSCLMEQRKIEAQTLALEVLIDDYVDLEMSHLQGAFIFLIIGIAASVICFFAELAMVKFRLKKLFNFKN
ncbi:Ionotropic receptor 226 [Blattella germanica]|nr:Ionotropic receptor 226 [Blattella germanica]